MLPATRAKTAKAARKLAVVQHVHQQKMILLKTVDDAVQQYCTSTGKTTEAAYQELFTIGQLNQRKRALCARDLYIGDRMKEVNRSAHPHYTCIVLEI